MHTPDDSRREDDVDRVLRHIEKGVREGLSRGFFECHIECEKVSGKKKRLKVTTTRSELFYIGEEDLKG